VTEGFDKKLYNKGCCRMLFNLRFWLLRIYDLINFVNKVFYKTVMPFIIVWLPFYFFMY